MALLARSVRLALNTGVQAACRAWTQPLVIGLHKQVANYSLHSHTNRLLDCNKVGNCCCVADAITRSFDLAEALIRYFF